MKAQARKILALIMAMVMSLSLAAPAFAAEEAVEDTSAEASVVETAEAEEPETEEAEEKVEAPKAEKKAKKGAKLAAQEATITIVPSEDGSGKYTINSKDGETTTTVAAGNVTDSTQPKGVTVEYDKGGVIGGPKAAIYKVTYAGATNSPADVTVGTDAGDMSFLDVSPWVDLEEGQTVQIDSKYYLVDGTIYQEKQLNGSGLYVPYFQLFKADVDNKSFKTDETPLYFKGVPGNELKNADDISKALESATQCDIFGHDVGEKDNVQKAGCTLPTEKVEDAVTLNSFSVMNESEGLEKVTTKADKLDTEGKVVNGEISVAFDSKTEKTTGSFQVSIKATTTKDGKTTTSYVTDTAEAQKLLAKYWKAGTNAKLESVEAASGNFVTVNVSKVVASDKLVESAERYAKNIVALTNVNDGVLGTQEDVKEYTAVLIDLSQDGWYNGTTDKGANAAAVPAGTEALGPVIVRKSELGNKIQPGTTVTDSNYYIYRSVEAMQKSISADDCTAAKTINYVQVVLNPWNGNKENKLVAKQDAEKKLVAVDKKTKAFVQVETGHEDAGLQVFGLIPNYYEQAYNTPNADFVKKGTFDVQAKEHGDKVVTEEVTTAPTCQAEGVKTIKTVCQTCKKVIDTKTEAIPAITDPVAKRVADDYKNYAFTGKPEQNYTHYVAKQEDVTTTDTATGVVTVTTNYTCNFGHVHTELAHVETFKKKDLQYSGKWDAISLDKYTALEQYNKQKGDLGLLKTVTVADTDIELTTVPMNRAGTDEFFKFDMTNMRGSYVDVKDNDGKIIGQKWVPVQTDADGNYFADQALAKGVDVYTSVTGLPTTKYYAAKLTVKDIKVSDTDCEDASCTVAVDVYEVAKATAVATNSNLKTVQDTCENAIKAANLEENLKNKKVTLVKSYSESVVIPGKGHQFFNSLGQATELCTKCGAKKPKETEATNDLSQATITIDPVKYAGTAMTEKDLNITVKLGKTTLARGIDFEVGELNIKAAGKYTVVVAGKGTYNGRQAIELTVTAQSTTAKKQTLKVSVAKKTFKVKTLKKKAQKFTTKLSGAKTAVTWKSSNKKVTVKGSKKKATITVKKGTKKGTYKVTATAKKTGAYKKGTVTVKVIVK